MKSQIIKEDLIEMKREIKIRKNLYRKIKDHQELDHQHHTLVMYYYQRINKKIKADKNRKKNKPISYKL